MNVLGCFLENRRYYRLFSYLVPPGFGFNISDLYSAMMVLLPLMEIIQQNNQKSILI